MFKPIGEHTHFLNAWREVYKEFGERTTDLLWQRVTYITYTDNRDFYNVLNEQPEIIEYCARIDSQNTDIPNFKHLVGNIWGRPYPEGEDK